MVTASYVRERLNYDPSTGVLPWRTSIGKRFKVGAVAGYEDPKGYLMVGLLGRNHRAHRLIWLLVHGRWPAASIDHINGVRSDNRLSNLREATPQTNMENQRKAHKDSRHGFLGVIYQREHPLRPWTARIQANKKSRYLGYFSTPEEAHEAYLTAKRQLHAGCTI
jgi:hypothetical protein